MTRDLSRGEVELTPDPFSHLELRIMQDTGYHHVQRSPWCLLLYLLAVVFFAVGVLERNTPLIFWLMPSVGVLMLLLAVSFHYLEVEDEGDELAIRFGPFPLFRRSIAYSRIVRAEVGRTTVLEGWGIHMSPGGGWVWNIWGRDCVVLHFQEGRFKLGTDRPRELADFVNSRVANVGAEPEAGSR